MRIVAVLVAIVASLAFVRPVARADATIDVQVREDATPFDPGRPVTTAWGAWIEEGWTQADAARDAVAADAAGIVRLPVAPSGSVALVWAPGREPVAIRVGAPIPQSVSMRPARACRIAVTDPKGAPIAGAEVVAVARIPILGPMSDGADVHAMLWTRATGGDGTVVLPDLADVPLSVTARADGYAPSTVFPVDPTRGVTIPLGRGSRVTGSVIVQPGGRPAANAKVVLGGRDVTTGADGTFEFRSVPPGPCDLSVSGEGFTAPPARALVLTDGTDRTGLVIETFARSGLRARIAPVEGRAHPAEVVVALDFPPQSGIAPVRTTAKVDADGAFVVAALPACDGVIARVSATGRVSALVPGVSLPAGAESRELDVALAPGGGVRGRIVARDDTPVAGAIVAASDGSQPTGTELARTVTDDLGGFAIDGLRPGWIRLRVVGRPLGGESAAGTALVVADTETDAGALAITDGSRLAGEVVGAPDGAVVRLLRDGAIAARAKVRYGAFAFDGVPAGPVDLQLEWDGETGLAAPVAVPAAVPVRLVWDGPVEVHGRIEGADGRPATRATLRVQPLGAGEPRTIELSDPAGLFHLRLGRGRWALDADDGAGQGGAIRLVVPEDAHRLLVLRLERGSTIRGEVVATESSGAVEGATVSVVVLGDRVARSVARTDAAGRFLLVGVPSGVARVRIESPDRGVVELDPVPVRDLDDIDVGRVLFEPGTELRGEIVSDGAPVPSAEVVVECDAGRRAAAVTDAWGRVAMTGLPRGGALVRVRSETGAVLVTRRIEVPGHRRVEPFRIDVAAGTRVRGEITTGSRESVALARVVVRTRGEVVAQASAVADVAGRFELSPLPPGDADVEVTLAGELLPWRSQIRIDAARTQIVSLRLRDTAIEGRVEATTGVPVAGAFVRAWPRNASEPIAAAVTDADGRFRLSALPDDDWIVLVARRDGFGAGRLQISRPRTEKGRPGLRIILEEEARVSLRAVDARLRPVSSAWARATFDAPGPGGHADVAAEADADGRIVLRGLAAGRWRIDVGAPGRGTKVLGTVAVASGDQDLGEIRVDTGGVLRVLAVLRDRPERLSGVRVVVRDVFGADPRGPEAPRDPLRGPDPAWVTGSDGVLEIPGLAAGTYEVLVEGAEPRTAIRVQVAVGRAVVAVVPVDARSPGERRK